MVSPSLYQKEEDESRSLKTLINGEDSNLYLIGLVDCALPEYLP